MKLLLRISGLIFLLAVTSFSFVRAQQTQNVILVTLDGVRWQEVFSGADSTLLFDAAYSPDTASARKFFWAANPQERRKLVFPFLWNTVAKEGQLYGNRLKGSKVNTSNPYWFSYPGYNEILSGYADERIKSNDKIDNPNTTVLEFLNNKPDFKGKIAAFSSWDVIEAAVNERKTGIYASAGNELIEKPKTATDSLLNSMMTTVPPQVWDKTVRPDFLTYYAAKNYLLQNRPRVLFMQFDETDGLAHAGRYADDLRMINAADAFLADLWKTVQQIPQYAGKTTLIVTTDHGRGHTPKATWKGHGTKTPDSYQLWFAVIGPDTPPTGEQSGGPVLFQNQLAATLARLLGHEFKCEHPVGSPVLTVLKR
ncbi:type I phosphodiesterase/nucleotide pyrophosphatase [Larkinella arboricola]|uniref:Type I phosphodiesterase/nucleotide pyrophosphatase n=1 Tax=Larkinella arboricola TaxID=643671 RepID=A0A327WP84_LARAB|nr:alkaline phosphatase family protein [Larkinella arboricola]RAJ94168.1 type I phosphodiesterase/nucleotide pyrophosphatase [Larkinella arboricola]